MIRVGWLSDVPAYVGGAELTQQAFRAASPDDVEIVECPPGQIDPDCERYAAHNLVSYTPADIETVGATPVVWYHHDVGPHVHPEVRGMLAGARHVCCSPLQAEHMRMSMAILIPPPVALERFAAAAASMNGGRRGAVCLGAWMNPGKAPHRVAEWAAGNGGIDFYGGGPFAPRESRPVDYEHVPGLLARYEKFVYLPNVLEPFGRAVVEAWAAGCELVINNLVGARYWITEQPAALETATRDFWDVVLT